MVNKQGKNGSSSRPGAGNRAGPQARPAAVGNAAEGKKRSPRAKGRRRATLPEVTGNPRITFYGPL